jgi:tellurite methyltransferase
VDVPRNWNEHYANPANLDFSPAPLLVQVAELVPPGRALDLACGYGRNSLYLASLGWQVTAVDSSSVAIGILRARSSEIDCRIADLEAGEFRIAEGAFDLICDFFYLQRDLFPQIREGVRPGGVFSSAIHLADGNPARNPAYVLQPGELRSEFAGWKISFYSESPEPGHSRRTARIIARKA